VAAALVRVGVSDDVAPDIDSQVRKSTERTRRASRSKISTKPIGGTVEM
jgi:hypothetical protein